MFVAKPSAGAIATTQTPEATVVRLSGEIDETLRTQASAAMSLLLRRHMPVELDTAQVTFINSAGLSFLVQCRTLARADGLEVSLRPPAPPVADLMDVTGVADLFRTDVSRPETR